MTHGARRATLGPFAIVTHFHLALVLIVTGASVASAAPLIPSSDLPGRERERFTDPPALRPMQPGGVTPGGPVITRPGKAKPSVKRKCRPDATPRSGKQRRTRASGC